MKGKKEEELLKIYEEIEKGIENIFVGDKDEVIEKYKKHLSNAKYLSKYSFRNIELIIKENENATKLRTYGGWRKEGNGVAKGEKAIKIITPIIKDDKVVAMRFMPLFDISQTVKYQDEEREKEIKNQSEVISEIREKLEKAFKIQIQYTDNIERELLGFYTYNSDGEEKIKIKDRLIDEYKLSVTIHEIAHKILHKNDFGKMSEKEKEIEAESVSFIVLNKLNLNTIHTDKRSFKYIDLFAKGKNAKEIINDLDRIINCSHEIIEVIEEKVEEQVEEKVEEQVEEKVEEQVEEKVEEQVEEKVEEQVEEKVEEQVEEIEMTM